MEVTSEQEAAIARVEKLDGEEPLLMHNPRRFVMFPIKHADIWRFYKKAEGMVVLYITGNVDGTINFDNLQSHKNYCNCFCKPIFHVGGIIFTSL